MRLWGLSRVWGRAADVEAGLGARARRGAGLGRGCGKRRVEAPPRRAPPAAARPLRQQRGRPAERRGAPPAWTPTTTTAEPTALREPAAWAALEGRGAAAAALQVKAGGLLRLRGWGLRGRARPTLPLHRPDRWAGAPRTGWGLDGDLGQGSAAG